MPDARWPILSSFLPMERPGLSRSTMNAMTFLCRPSGFVVAKTTYQLASDALVMKHFWPFSTHSSPTLRARHWMPAASLPAAGSVIA